MVPMQGTNNAVYQPKHDYNKHSHGKACHKIPEIRDFINIQFQKQKTKDRHDENF